MEESISEPEAQAKEFPQDEIQKNKVMESMNKVLRDTKDRCKSSTVSLRGATE